jgi:hypothetical protein
VLNDPAFHVLCDIVASDRLVFVTGAGISQGLTRDGGGKVPNWADLLGDLLIARIEMGRAGSLPQEDVEALVHPKATGRALIEAASLLRAGWPEFDVRFREAVTPAEIQDPKLREQKDQLHRAILELAPRGILTFNYDREHERAIRTLGGDLDRWNVLNPIDPAHDETMRRALEGNLAQPFLMKAHGSLDSAEDLVLTFESYRELIAKRPAYLAFVQNLFTNFHFVIVGFSISDPDFDLFRDTMAAQFGSPLRNHVVIRGPLEDEPTKRADAVVLRRRYGIHTLHAGAYDRIPEVLRLAARTPGQDLDETVRLCLSSRVEERNLAHQRLRRLGPAGKRVASRVLRDRIVFPSSSTTDLSEMVYSLGALDPHEWDVRRDVKDALLGVLEAAQHVEPAAHALDRLGELADIEDLDRLEHILRRLKTHPLPSDKENPDPDDRLPVYIERLILRIRARRKHFPPRPTPAD